MSRPIAATATGSFHAQTAAASSSSSSSSTAPLSSSLPFQKPLSALPLHLRRSISSSTTPKAPAPKGTPAKASQTPKLALPARTSKSAKKLVFLPEDVQSQPLPASASSSTNGPPSGSRRVEERNGEGEREEEGSRGGRSEAERMNKEEREKHGLGRLTTYATADSYRLRTLAAFLKREHNAEVRQYDEALYAVYTLPLLPGYNPNVNVRSSLAVTSPGGASIVHKMDYAEERGYEGSYFPQEEEEGQGGSKTEGGGGEGGGGGGLDMESNSIPDVPRTSPPSPYSQLSTSPESNTNGLLYPIDPPPAPSHPLPPIPSGRAAPKLAEAVFFDYGVSVFFGFDEEEERLILEDCERAAEGWVGALGSEGASWEERGWEREEYHFEYDPTAPYPRIFNDMFTFKSPSHLLKLSLSHALAQSAKLSIYESLVQSTMADASYIPKELAMTGTLGLDRKDAVKLTGRLFKLRVDVNLVSNVLDTPELFWSEASLQPLYDAIREYVEIDDRVLVLNERLGVVGDLLDMIHQHVDEAGMRTVTWIVIWLIVLACCVEAGEIMARLVVHATKGTTTSGGSALMTFLRK